MQINMRQRGLSKNKMNEIKKKNKKLKTQQPVFSTGHGRAGDIRRSVLTYDFLFLYDQQEHNRSKGKK